MSPLPPEDPITVPQWVADYIVVPIGLGVVWCLQWLGNRVLENYVERIDELEEQVECMEDKLDRVLDHVES